MRSSLRQTSVFWLAIAGAVVAIECITPSTALADCGDYVVYTKSADAAKHNMSPGATRCSGPNCKHPVPTIPAPTECKGPNCRKNAPNSPSGPSTKVQTPVDEVSPIEVDESIDTASVRSHFDAVNVSTFHFAADIYHPPR